MYTAGLVIRLGSSDGPCERARRELQSSPGLTWGVEEAGAVAAVLEATGPQEARDWHDWACSLPGVQSVDVAFIHWDDMDAEASHGDA